MRPQTILLVEDSSFDTVERCLVEMDLGAVVVVDAERQPIGIITKSDLLRRGPDACDDEPDVPIEEGALHLERRTQTAADVMTPVVHALPDDAPVAYGIALLATAEVEQVPIVGSTGEAVGLFTTIDAVRWLARELGYHLKPV